MEYSFTSAHLEPGRPPMAVLRVDLSVVNHGAARWLLVPTAVPSTSGGVDGVEVKSGGGVSVGRFQGPGAFFALHVPAGETVKIQGLALESWAEGPVSQIELPIRVGSTVTVGGEPIEAWMGSAVSKGSVTYDSLTPSGKRFTPDRGSVPVVVGELEGSTARVFVR